MPVVAHLGERRASTARSSVSTVAAVMREYANRAVFQGLSQTQGCDGIASFRMTWHRNREFDLVVDTRRGRLTFPVLLPALPSDPSMYVELKGFVASHQLPDRPEHRRIDPRKGRVTCSLNRKRDVSLTLTVKDGDYDYAIQRLVQLVHEIYLIFLANGMYYDYKVEQLNADPDWG